MEPLKDKRFVKYLIAYGLTVMACWWIFTKHVLPALSLDGWESFVAIIFYTAIISGAGVLFINAYEAGEK